jgi:diguanylate cyclase (GGDEF)-like protein
MSGQPLSLLMVDLVHYKQGNDTYGHEVGNLVLTQIAALLRGAMRETDIVCRYGGDEFVVMLRRTNREQAEAAAYRLEGRMRTSQIDVPDIGPIATPHLTIGVSTFPFPAASGEELVRQADVAQYQAKALCPPAVRSFEATP